MSKAPKSLEAKAGFWIKDVAKWNGGEGKLSGRCQSLFDGHKSCFNPATASAARTKARYLGQPRDKLATQASVARAFMAYYGAQPVADHLD